MEITKKIIIEANSEDADLILAEIDERNAAHKRLHDNLRAEIAKLTIDRDNLARALDDRTSELTTLMQKRHKTVARKARRLMRKLTATSEVSRGR